MADKQPVAPTHRVYTVIKREGQDDYWLNIGLAFPHKDGKGFNIVLQALPLDGKIVCREITNEEEEKRGTIAGSPGRRTQRSERAPAMSTEKVRALNDTFRTTLTGGKVPLTAGVNALPSDVKAMAIQRVATFSEFNEENDPHREHDFGNFSLAGRKFFFKIDYYNSNMEFGSEDPSDPAKTTRVLTIMLVEEY